MAAKKHKRSLKNEVKPEARPVAFSFKYLDRTDADFPIDGCCEAWLRSLMERLEAFSRMTRTELQDPGKAKTLRSHGIEWAKTIRAAFNIPREDEVVERPWQLGVGMGNGRFHGFFIGDVFYVRWLDPNHKLYPKK